MKKAFISITCGLLLMAASGAQALQVSNSGLYLNEIISGTSAITDPTGGAFTGLGSISRTYTTAGSYNVLSFIDNEIDLSGTGFDPEFGGVVGAPGYSYQIADPSSLAANFFLGGLNGSINKLPADVAVAMGWTFNLLAGQRATINFIVSDTAPADGYLTHTDAVYLDPQQGSYKMLTDKIYYTSTLSIENIGPAPVPEPSTFVLLGSALAGLGLYARKRRNG